MLFSYHPFILLFLPFSLLLYFWSARYSQKLAIFSILAMSSIFYSWKQPMYLALIFGSIFINYYCSKKIAPNAPYRRRIFWGAIAFNVLAIFLFKYLDFLIGTINGVFSTDYPYWNIPLPLAISFFTFQQIGYLASVYTEEDEVPSFVNYSAFITFFPQLIAGPIVKHGDYLPQLKKESTFRVSWRNLIIGATLFTLGLYKKTILADNLGDIADPIFGVFAQGKSLGFVETWIGVLSYSFQIYFDFSGYSDMAIGLARMFNIHLPCNFLSPYKATSIIDFWRRWHISLSSFLKKYVYVPLGGNRKGVYFRYQNLIITMLIGGLWHGASWTFVIWGAIHGLYLMINHAIRNLFGKSVTPPRILSFFKTMVTFFLVCLAWVFFRAETFSEALAMMSSLFDVSQIHLPNKVLRLLASCNIDIAHFQASASFFFGKKELINIALFLPTAFVVVFLFPNVYDWLAYFLPAKDYVKSHFVTKKWFKRICWRPTWVFGIIIFILLTIAFGGIDAKKEFIYFQF